jgi:hypothetical protein
MGTWCTHIAATTRRLTAERARESDSSAAALLHLTCCRAPLLLAPLPAFCLSCARVRHRGVAVVVGWRKQKAGTARRGAPVLWCTKG